MKAMTKFPSVNYLQRHHFPGVTNETECQEINLALKREILSLNVIGKPKKPQKCKDGSEGSSINHHQRTIPLLESEINLKQMKLFTTSTRNVLDDHGQPPALEKKSMCGKPSFDPHINLL